MSPLKECEKGSSVKEESKNLVSEKQGLTTSAKFWALVAASFVFWKVLPKQGQRAVRKNLKVPSDIVPRAMNQLGHRIEKA